MTRTVNPGHFLWFRSHRTVKTQQRLVVHTVVETTSRAEAVRQSDKMELSFGKAASHVTEDEAGGEQKAG